MRHPVLLVILGLTALSGSAPALTALAQGNPPGTVTCTSAVGGSSQLAGDLGRGGGVSWSSVTFGCGVTRQFVPAFAAGLSLHYDAEDWRIRSAPAFGGLAPWRSLRRPGVGLNASLAQSHGFAIGVSPTVEWAYDSRAGAGDACTYGAALTAVGVFSPVRVLGGGVSVTRQFYSVKTSPFVVVRWRLTDRLRVANAAASGPLGGAGVELCDAIAPGWEAAVGGVWRSDRWRLAPAGAPAARVGETSSIPLLARVTRSLGAGARFDLYAGAAMANRLTLKDDDGRELAHDDYEVVPTFSATIAGRF